ncbi:hypothetical protein ASC61_05035 [Aeromicrobium sp. Root344]|nr:hypothetical protein ASC61_05035 [Aeromicrobium sp. Root344]
MILLLVAGCSGSSTDEPPGLTYAALGDSYVSGTVGQGAELCQRLSGRYPALVARAVKASRFADASCGGATTQDIVEPANRAGRSVAAQLDDVPTSSDVITVGIGANDRALYPSIFYGCFIETTRTDKACDSALASATSGMTAIRQSVSATLSAVRAHAPKAEVILVGYLRIAPATGACPALGPAARVHQFATVEDLMARAQATAAKEAGVRFVDVHAASAGHDSCSKDPWTNPLTAVGGDGIVLHPRSAGMKAVAALVEPYVERAARSARQG